MYEIVYTKRASKDFNIILKSELIERARNVLEAIEENPYNGKKLVDDMNGKYSMRINIKNRVVYSVHSDLKVVKVHSMWGHYG